MLPPMISYAQNYEDVALRRAFADQESGFYVDVGAADPYYDSVTHWFYTAGWSGINIEPLHHWFTEFQVQRPRDINLNVGVGQTKGMRIFHEVSNHGLSTFDDEAAGTAAALGYDVTRRQVEVRTLADICQEFRPPRIDFLKIDAEGWEAEVLHGADWRAYRPRVVLVEATRPNTQEAAHAEWESILTEAGYEFAWFDCLNRFYVRSEERALKESLARPPSYFDNFRSARAVDHERRLEQALKAEGACETRAAALEQRLQQALKAEQACEVRVVELEQRVLACGKRIAATDGELAHIRGSLSYRIASWVANPLKRSEPR